MEKCSAGNRFRKRILLGFRTVLPAGSLRFGDFGGVIAEEKDCFLEFRISEVLAAQARIFGEKILPFLVFRGRKASSSVFALVLHSSEVEYRTNLPKRYSFV